MSDFGYTNYIMMVVIIFSIVCLSCLQRRKQEIENIKAQELL